MANPEHVETLKQGVEVWNRWRQKRKKELPDLSEVDLPKAILSGADLSRAKLTDANLSRAKLYMADLSRADLSRANLFEAKLYMTDLSRSKLFNADFSNADLSGAFLPHANFFNANLSNANLSSAHLSSAHLWCAILSMANLNGANFKGCSFYLNSIGGVDLSKAKNLEQVDHKGRSFIDTNTFIESDGSIPESFLRGCGVPEIFIQYLPSLMSKPIQFYSCFISYSSKDQAFAERLHADLQNKGVRCWFAPEDMKIGDKIRDRIDQSIKLHDKLLLVLSENSINSDWVEDEVEAAYEQERTRGQTVLFPIRLDDAVMDTNKAWAAKLRRSRHIGDFTKWKDHDSYRKAFDRLLRDLKAEKK
jgi:hypothetical protein